MSSAPLKGSRITELWAWVAIDPETDIEAIVGGPDETGRHYIPYIGFDEECAMSYAPIVRAKAHREKINIQLKKFSWFTVMREFKGAR